MAQQRVPGLELQVKPLLLALGRDLPARGRAGGLPEHGHRRVEEHGVGLEHFSALVAVGRCRPIQVHPSGRVVGLDGEGLQQVLEGSALDGDDEAVGLGGLGAGETVVLALRACQERAGRPIAGLPGPAAEAIQAELPDVRRVGHKHDLVVHACAGTCARHHAPSTDLKAKSVLKHAGVGEPLAGDRFPHEGCDVAALSIVVEKILGRRQLSPTFGIGNDVRHVDGRLRTLDNLQLVIFCRQVEVIFGGRVSPRRVQHLQRHVVSRVRLQPRRQDQPGLVRHESAPGQAREARRVVRGRIQNVLAGVGF
mmetsp:Transcript_113316/g.360223  ORF Transcript_113316/g.360223 Transcript_113316/m.360223 type:complete len:309 (+) Transcript_113316:4926-5852(+)